MLIACNTISDSGSDYYAVIEMTQAKAVKLVELCTLCDDLHRKNTSLDSMTYATDIVNFGEINDPESVEIDDVWVRIDKRDIDTDTGEFNNTEMRVTPIGIIFTVFDELNDEHIETDMLSLETLKSVRDGQDPFEECHSG
jgi:hypothetical protein